MADDPFTPKPTSTLADRLKATGSRMSDLSKKAADATKEAAARVAKSSKEAADKVATASKEAANKTSEAVSEAVQARKDKKHEKLTQKIEDTKAELKDDGYITVAPAMITLPEFEEERMAVMADEHDILVDLVDHMQALSERIDGLERKYRAVAQAELASPSPLNEGDVASTTSRATARQQQPMTAALSLLGSSLVWVVLLTGLDRYLTSNDIMLFTNYPAQIPVWGLGAGSWLVFVLHQIGKTAPLLKVPTPMLVQTGVAVAITTMMALLLSDDTISTMSGMWTWGTAIAVAVLVSSSLIASAYRTTKTLLTPNETVDIID